MLNTSYRVRALAAAVSLLLPIAGHADTATGSGRQLAEKSVVDSHGSLRVPENYRLDYQYLGSWAIAGRPGSGSKELHIVFASPGAAEAYRASETFPQGTVLVKEVFQATTTSMTTGTVSHSKSLKGWFVMVRDTTGQHVGNKLWGEGWGWSWFDAANPTKTTSIDYKSDCRGCHVPAQATDWIYVDGYPSLRREASAGAR